SRAPRPSSARSARPPGRASPGSPVGMRTRTWAAPLSPWPASCAWRLSGASRSTRKPRWRACATWPGGCSRPRSRRRGRGRRGVPVRTLGGGLLVLGQGARQRRVLGARTDRTGALAEDISRDADLTRDLLRAAGVPLAAPDAPGARRWRLLVVGGRVAAALG